MIKKTYSNFVMFLALSVAVAFASCTAVESNTSDDGPWVSYAGQDGPAKGKHVVLISGDEEYRSEETLPMLAQILSGNFGFTTTVLFAIDSVTGEIDANEQVNIPGLAHLQNADLMVIATRFRELPPEQMQYVDEYLKAGKPVVGLRTATHAFHYARNSEDPYAMYDFRSSAPGWEGGFGKVVLGETWISHHGIHGEEGTRGAYIDGRSNSPILNGVEEIWGPTDVYTVGELDGADILMYGMSTSGMTNEAPDNIDKEPLPIVWTRSYQVPGGQPGKAFTTTMGASVDFLNEDLRRLFVNACLWAVGLENEIPQRADVDYQAPYEPSMFGFDSFIKGKRPADYRLNENK